MNVDSDAGATESEDGNSSSESEDDRGDPDTVFAMHQMSRKEVDAAFILSNLKRRIIHHQLPRNQYMTWQ